MALKTGAKPGAVQFREALRTLMENVKGVARVGTVQHVSPRPCWHR